MRKLGYFIRKASAPFHFFKKSTKKLFDEVRFSKKVWYFFEKTTKKFS